MHVDNSFEVKRIVSLRSIREKTIGEQSSPQNTELVILFRCIFYFGMSSNSVSKESEDFPYHANFLLKDDLVNRYHAHEGVIIRKKYSLAGYYPLDGLSFDPLFLNKEGKREYLYIQESKETDLRHLTDIYSEDRRVRAVCKGFGLSKSPMDEFLSIPTPLKKKGNESWDVYSTIRKERDDLYKRIAETQNFRLTWWKPLLKELCKLAGTSPEYVRLLDMCKGWGDRLLGFCLDTEKDKENTSLYFGFDPHRKLPSAYDNIIRDFRAEKRVKYVSCPFEDSEEFLKDQNFQVAFTSPPFFDYETYENNPQQSDRKFSSDSSETDPTTLNLKWFDGLEKWKKGFLFVMLDIAWKHLTKGGVLALYMCDFRSPTFGRYCPKVVNICDSVIQYMKETHKNSVFRGPFGLEGTSKIRPVWVWTKN